MSKTLEQLYIDLMRSRNMAQSLLTEYALDLLDTTDPMAEQSLVKNIREMATLIRTVDTKADELADKIPLEVVNALLR